MAVGAQNASGAFLGGDTAVELVDDALLVLTEDAPIPR